MDEESPSLMEENELVSLPSPKVEHEDEYLTWEKKFFDSNGKNPKKRRLVITTMLEEPILIEIRPNLIESMVHPLVSNSIQCNIIETMNCKQNACLKHLSLWKEVYQVIQDANTLNLCEEDWFEKQGEDGDVDIGIEKQINCSELCPKLCSQALDKVVHFKLKIQRINDEMEKEKERCIELLAKQSDLEKQFELEKDMRNQDCKKYEVLISELKNQITSQAEEIRRLWIENLADESDELITKSNDIIHEEETPKTNQYIEELQLQLAKALEQHKIVSKNQEIQCEIHHINDTKYSNTQGVTLLQNIECENLLSIEELEKEKLQHQVKITLSSNINKNNNDHIIDYETLINERDNLKEKLEKANNDFNCTSIKLRDNVAKRRRLEVESEGEKEQRSHLAAALYELESEVEVTISIINSLQSTAFESMATLTSDLQNFEEAFKKHVIPNHFESKILTQNDDGTIKLFDGDIIQSPIQNLERTSSKKFRGIPNTESVISKVTHGHENLLAEIISVKKTIHRALKIYKCQTHITEQEMTSKLGNIESEKKKLHQRIKVVEEENKQLEDDNSRLHGEISSLKHTKSTLNLQLKDLEKEMEVFQESLKNLREENRRLLKEAKWKSVGKQGGCQESLIVQEWEKKLQKLEGDYEIVQHAKRDLVKEKHRLEDELDKATEKSYKELGGSENRILEEDLSTMTQERNKLRKIKITLAIENVSLKESLAELRIQADILENECITLLEWKKKAQKLEEECEDLQDWKKKADGLEVECKDLRNHQMKVEAHEFECQIKNSKTKELEGKHQKCHKKIETIDKECQSMCCSNNCYEDECKSLRECIANLEKECKQLQQRINSLDKDRSTLFKLKEKFEKYIENDEFHDVDKLKMDFLECRFETLSEIETKAEEKNTNLNQLDSANVSQHYNVEEYLEKIANLEQENVKLCQNHQVALDKQWDVLQGDLKAFEAKVEELENECESVRRDHLSSMVENAELIREKERLLLLYNDQKYNYKILETSNECLKKYQEQKKAEQMTGRNDYQSSIDNLNRQIVELESTFSERLHQQASSYKLCLAPKMKANGREITLSCQEYEILLAEKAVMLQERDSAHKKLCSVEAQNLQLSARIECLRKELPCSNQGYKEIENDAEVLLAQDVVNLRSMLSSQEDELKSATCERNKLLDVNKSLRGELKQLNEAISRCQHENQNLNVTLDELKRRSSLEQIHSAASSLKDQLGKASKEKDLFKEQLTRAIKEKEQLTNIANERDKVINSLKEKISTLEKGKKYTLATQLQDVSNNVSILTKENDQSMALAEESSNAKEVVILKHEIDSLRDKILLVNHDLIEKTKSWQKERSNFEEKCRRLEFELMNTREAQALIKNSMEDELQEAIQAKNYLESVARNEVKCIHVQVCELQDKLPKAKNFFEEKMELATKEMEYIKVEINMLLQEMIELKRQMGSVQNEKEDISDNIVKYNEHTKHSIISNGTNVDANQPNLYIPKNPFEQGVQLILCDNLQLESREMSHLDKNMTLTIIKQNDEMVTSSKERDYLALNATPFKIEKNDQSQDKDTCSCNCSLIQVPKCENNLECCLTLNENHDIQTSEVKKKSCHETATLYHKLHVLETKVNILNEQLLDLTMEKDQLTFAKQSLLEERDGFIVAIEKLEAEKDLSSKKIWQHSINNKMFSLKALLATVAKEKEQVAISKESLDNELDNHSITMQSVHEQLVSLSYEKNCVVHANEVVTLERDSLLEKNAALEKKLQTIAKIENETFQEDTNDTFSSTYKKLLLGLDQENLIPQIEFLKKEKEDMENKLDKIIVENCTSINNYRNTLDKAQCDIYMKNEHYGNLTKENAKLKEENVILVQIKNLFLHECKNVLMQISIVKKDNEEMKKIFRDEMALLSTLKNKIFEAIGKKYQMRNDENSIIQHSSLIEVNKFSQDMHQKNLDRGITTLNQPIRNLFEGSKSLLNKCKKYDQLQSDCCSLLQSKNNISAECETIFKKLIVLSSNNEEFEKYHLANLFDSDQISSCIVTIKVEVCNLNERIFALYEHVTNLVEENEKLCVELQASKFNNARISMNEEQQTCMPNTVEIGILCNVESVRKFDGELIKERKYLDADLKNLNTELKFFKQQNDELRKERDNLITLLKTKKSHVDTTSIEIVTLKQNLMLLSNKYDQLVLDKDNAVGYNEFFNQQYEVILGGTSALTTNNNDSSIESQVNETVVLKDKSRIYSIKTLQLAMKSLEEKRTKLNKDNMEASLEIETLKNEKNSLFTTISLLKKEHEDILAQDLKTKGAIALEMNLQHKLEELLQSMSTLNKSQAFVAEKEFMKHTTESLTKECDNLLTTITSLKDMKTSTNFNVEHHQHEKVDQSLVEKERIVILIKGSIVSTKERKKSIQEMASLKRECQRLHTTLIALEKDKDNLMKNVLESRSTIDCLGGEISRLQRDLVEIELKLAHLTIERDNANLQLADFQVLLNNHNRMQNLQGPYSLKKIETLEAQNRCLRMEKEVMEDHLKKCSIDLDGNYQFQQPLPSMANFKIQKIDSHPLSHPSLHNSSQLFLSGGDSNGRPRPPLHTMIHQQWPI